MKKQQPHPTRRGPRAPRTRAQRPPAARTTERDPKAANEPRRPFTWSRRVFEDGFWILMAERKRARRPKGSRDRRPRLVSGFVPGFDRATYERLAEQLQHAQSKLRWRGARVFREVAIGSPLALNVFNDPKVRALLAAIGTRATRVKILRRIIRRFGPRP